MFSGNTSQVSDDKLFVEDVFSTWLYTGTGAAQTITNGIDLAGKGGLVWTKSRSNAIEHNLIDTVRGGGNGLSSNTTAASTTGWGTTFSSTGFTAGAGTYNTINNYTYASWTFREAPKFFDVVTYTGTGANRTIAHNLGVAPGCILVKRTDNIADWQVYHRSNANTEYMVLNTTAAKATGATRWNSTTPTATEFTVGTDATVNASGGTYVAYLFAHDTASDGVIQCGVATSNATAFNPVNLGWEPQFIIAKATDRTSNWWIFDNMRGNSAVEGSAQGLWANLSNAEGTYGTYGNTTSTGFQLPAAFGTNATYIYIAIRRGPMKTPTLGTSVFAPASQTGGGTVTTNFPTDFTILKATNNVENSYVFDRLRGTRTSASLWLNTNTISAETSSTGYGLGYDRMTTVQDNFGGLAYNYAYWNFRRAPGFMDEVCYTGTGSATPKNHNLGVTPELIIIKGRSSAFPWRTWYTSFGLDNTIQLNSSSAVTNSPGLYSSLPTSTTFPTASGIGTDNSGATYVAYLFASCPGVSKVGSYTGNGSSQTIDCGFAAGARFVMIKRTDNTGDWYVWDTARGIVAGNDPHLSLNTTAAQVTTDDTIDTDSSGFVVNQVAATNVNVSSATYIYLAIA